MVHADTEVGPELTHRWGQNSPAKPAYGAKFPKAVAKTADDLDQLLAFYDYPAEHWVHLRTTNPSRPLPPSGTGPRSPRAPDRGPPGWPWHSSSSNQPKTAGAWSTHRISSRWSAPERPSPTANSSNDPARSPARSRLKDLDPQVSTIALLGDVFRPGPRPDAVHPGVRRL